MAEPTTPRQLDQLIAENQLSNPSEKRVARSLPRNHEATKGLLNDKRRMEALADLAEVDRDKIIDAAIRGNNVTFVVIDDEGAPSDGMFAVADLPDPSGPDEVTRLRAKVADLERQRATDDRLKSESDQMAGLAALPTNDEDTGTPPESTPRAARTARAPGKPKPTDPAST